MMRELEKILEEIREYANHVCGDFSKSAQYIAWAKRMIRGIEDIIRKHMHDGWIPVEKELPPEPTEYVDDEDNIEECIVMIDGAEKPTTLRYAGDGTWLEDGIYYPVIAWRPLPEPYRPERSEE